MSWSGRTIVMHGVDASAIARNERPGYVARSTDFGDTWTDETGDIVTMALNSGVWFGPDYYLTTSGEGILMKRNFEGAPLEKDPKSASKEELMYV